MAKPTSPLLSFGAAGQVGKTIVYAKWKGRNYTRRYVIPANPKSTKQTQTRSVFSWLQSVWKVAPSLFQDIWTQNAKGQVLTNRNAWSKYNIGTLRSAADLSGIELCVGNGGGVAADSATFTAGASQITITSVNPTAPAGYTLTSMVGVVIADQDPQTDTLYAISAEEDTATMDTVTITGLTTGTLYRCAAVLKWTKSDGSIAYGPQVFGSATPT